jgi:hypothetical protein
MARVMLEDLREAINAEDWNLLRVVIQNNSDISLDKFLLEAIEHGSPSYLGIATIGYKQYAWGFC